MLYSNLEVSVKENSENAFLVRNLPIIFGIPNARLNAKNRAMKGKHLSGSPAAELAVDRPNRVRALFRGIKAQLEAVQGREIPHEELAHYAAQSKSSVFDKLQKAYQPQVEALLGWLERLPEPTRNKLVNGACRC